MLQKATHRYRVATDHTETDRNLRIRPLYPEVSARFRAIRGQFFGDNNASAAPQPLSYANAPGSAATNRFISSGVPMLTRAQSVNGGNARPMRKPALRK